jgi:hypothetical protein
LTTATSNCSSSLLGKLLQFRHYAEVCPDYATS